MAVGKEAGCEPVVARFRSGVCLPALLREIVADEKPCAIPALLLGGAVDNLGAWIGYGRAGDSCFAAESARIPSVQDDGGVHREGSPRMLSFSIQNRIVEDIGQRSIRSVRSPRKAGKLAQGPLEKSGAAPEHDSTPVGRRRKAVVVLGRVVRQHDAGLFHVRNGPCRGPRTKCALPERKDNCRQNGDNGNYDQQLNDSKSSS